MATAESSGVEGHGSWGAWGGGQDVSWELRLGLMGGVILPPHPRLKGVSKPKVTRIRIGKGCKIRTWGHLMPEDPRVTPSLSTAQCWWWSGEWGWASVSSFLPHGGRSYPQPQGSLNLFNLASHGRTSSSNLCDLGAGYCQWGVQSCTLWSVSHSLPRQSLGSGRDLGVGHCYTVPLLPSVSECLNPKLEALFWPTDWWGEERSLSSQPLLHTIHIPEPCPDQACWAAQRSEESLAPLAESFQAPWS